MSLFGLEHTSNLLPYNGEVFLFPSFLSTAQPHLLHQDLIEEIDLVQDEVFVFGKKHIMNRSSAWYGDEPYTYGYSGLTRKAKSWPIALRNLKLDVESTCDFSFNSCLVNYYPSGNDGMGYHADNEKELGVNPVIASVSLGCERVFNFKHNSTGKLIKINLPIGSLLLMKGETQQFWKHSLPKTTIIKKPRINLTFRNILN